MHFITTALALAAALSANTLAQDAPSNAWDKYAEERGFAGYEDPRELQDLHARSADAEAEALASWEEAHGGKAPIYHANHGFPSPHYAARSIDEDDEEEPHDFSSVDGVISQEFATANGYDFHPPSSILSTRSFEEEEDAQDLSDVVGIMSKRFADDNGYDYHPRVVLSARDLTSDESDDQEPADFSENFDFDPEEYSTSTNEDQEIFRRDAAAAGPQVGSPAWEKLQTLIKNKQHAIPAEVVEEEKAVPAWMRIQQLIKNKHHPIARDVEDEEETGDAGSSEEAESVWAKLQHIIKNKHHAARSTENPFLASDEDLVLTEAWARANGYDPIPENYASPIQARDADTELAAASYPPSTWAKLQHMIKDKHHPHPAARNAEPEPAAASYPASTWEKLQGLIKDRHHAHPQIRQKGDVFEALLRQKREEESSSPVSEPEPEAIPAVSDEVHYKSEPQKTNVVRKWW